jgi:transporter family protein
MASGLLFATLAAIAFGLWTVFHQQASMHIDQFLGAILVSLTAVIAGLLIFFPHLTKIEWSQLSGRGLLFIALAGLSALALDVLVLKAYSSGLPVSVGGPIIIGGSIVIASVIGFFLGESITILKVLAILLVVVGAGLLSVLGK